MLKRKLTVIATVVVVAAIVGIVAGQRYAGATVGAVRAEDSAARELPQPPAWAELHVAYLISEADSTYPGFAPANFAKTINAQGLTTAAEAIKLSHATGLDILIISKNSLQSVDAQWAAAQYRRGTAFVGLNITPQELGKLIDDPNFANQWGDMKFAEPFLSKTWVKVTGNPKQIEAAWKAGLIGPEHDADLLKAGFDNVFITGGGGYGPPVSDDGSLVTDLDDIRYNLNSQSLVKPWQP